MDFMQRLRAFISRLTYGRYGSDQLSRAIEAYQTEVE